MRSRILTLSRTHPCTHAHTQVGRPPAAGSDCALVGRGGSAALHMQESGVRPTHASACAAVAAAAARSRRAVGKLAYTRPTNAQQLPVPCVHHGARVRGASTRRRSGGGMCRGPHAPAASRPGATGCASSSALPEHRRVDGDKLNAPTNEFVGEFLQPTNIRPCLSVLSRARPQCCTRGAASQEHRAAAARATMAVEHAALWATTRESRRCRCACRLRAFACCIVRPNATPFLCLRLRAGAQGQDARARRVHARCAPEPARSRVRNGDCHGERAGRTCKQRRGAGACGRARKPM